MTAFRGACGLEAGYVRVEAGNSWNGFAQYAVLKEKDRRRQLWCFWSRSRGRKSQLFCDSIRAPRDTGSVRARKWVVTEGKFVAGMLQGKYLVDCCLVIVGKNARTSLRLISSE
jgi:hypothetical protein